MPGHSGIFTISLDFELHWGGFEKWPLPQWNQYFFNTREVIPEILTRFERAGISATWATVGMLMHDNKMALEQNMPVKRPSYENGDLSAYNYIAQRGIGNSEQADPLHFALSLVKKIISLPSQELATHTFSHFYCNEPGQNVHQFRDDLRAAKKTAGALGKELRSLVFPRNQFNNQYLSVCFDEGIRAVRSNPLDWFWNIGSTQNESIWKRANRGLDAYFPIGKNNTYSLQSLQRAEHLPLCIPASRLLRPYRPQEALLNDLKIKRITSEMERAAKNNEVYHLWWHPHNFGHYPEQSLAGLDIILQHFTRCRQQWGMQSLTMGELATMIFDEA